MLHSRFHGWTVNLFLLMALAAVVGGCRRDQSLRPAPKMRVDQMARTASAQPVAETRSAVNVTTVQATPVAVGSGGNPVGYIPLGSVVADVNGTAIFAHELLRQVAPVLRAKAPELSAASFRAFATTELKRQRENLVRDELVYAAAEKQATPADRSRAQRGTEMYRERLVSIAGGSEELARQRAAEQGDDFDRMLEKRRREYMVEIFRSRKVYPRVQISVDEMRRHYERNREKLFTERAAVTWRMIMVDIAKVGDEAAAVARANEAHARAIAGEDFAALAEQYNADSTLVARKGQIGPLGRGSFAFEEVEKVVWDTPVNRVSAVVREKNRLFIVYPTERTEGRQQQFEEQAVQDQIMAALREQKIGTLYERSDSDLRKEAIVTATDAMLAPAVEMAMHLYPQWHTQAAGTSPAPAPVQP